MIKFNNSNYVKNLPDCFHKGETGNNYKILEVERYPVTNLKKDIEDVVNALDLNAATGRTLDLYGDMVGQPRGVATDQQYILMIRSKIMRNLSTGDYSSILESICATFACEPSEVIITEKEGAAAVELVSLPLSIINRAGLTTKQTVKMVKQLLPAGVTLESFMFEGTFEFSESETDMSIDGDVKGFCDVDGGTIGGYLGVTGNDISDDLLPI